jgi:hypothetical protein
MPAGQRSVSYIFLNSALSTLFTWRPLDAARTWIVRAIYRDLPR